jgi:hypothetical protein
MILIYLMAIFPHELLFVQRRELKINWERLLISISQYLQILSGVLGPTIKGSDVFLVNHAS